MGYYPAILGPGSLGGFGTTKGDETGFIRFRLADPRPSPLFREGPMNNTFLLRTAVAIVATCALATPAVSAPKNAKKKTPDEQAVLLGQFGDWGAYKADPNGKEVCFALSKPTKSATTPPGRNRDPAYAFVSTRPAEKVKNEVSIIVGYPQKAGFEATATIDGSAKYAMYTQDAGAWVKNAAEESQMVK